jgi:hypothetical protein
MTTRTFHFDDGREETYSVIPSPIWQIEIDRLTTALDAARVEIESLSTLCFGLAKGVDTEAERANAAEMCITALKAEMAFDAILHADREHDLTCEWERANDAEAEVTLLKAAHTDNAIHYADCLRNLQHERDRADEAEVQVLLARTELSHLLVHRVLQALPQEAPANRQVET